MDKLERISDYIGIEEKKLEKNFVYNGFANIDSELYINPKLLIDCNIKEFKNSYNKITNHFEKIIDCLKKCEKGSKKCLMWELALKLFCFPEPEGVALGISEFSMNGKGLSGKTAEDALSKLKEMVDNDIEDPQMFGLLAIIQKNIGVDRVSDMLANIIYDDLLTYSQRVFIDLNITNLTDIIFNEKKYSIMLRRNGKPLILIPQSILSNIPPFIDYYSIQSIIDENLEIKKHIYKMFYEVSKKLKKKKLSQVNINDLDKEQIYTLINKFKLFDNIIQENNSKIIKPYDFVSDEEGIHKPIEKITNMVINKERDVVNQLLNTRNDNFINLVEDLINNYKFIIENKGLNEDLYHKIKVKNGKTYLKPKHEGTSHRLFIATLDSTKKIYNFDYTYEPKSSNGEVDFRFYRNDEVIVVEFKLSTNKLSDGYDKQLIEYMKREKAKYGFLVILKVKDDKVIEKFLKKTKIKNNRPVIIIDALLKSSPSEIHEKDNL